MKCLSHSLENKGVADGPFKVEEPINTLLPCQTNWTKTRRLQNLKMSPEGVTIQMKAFTE